VVPKQKFGYQPDLTISLVTADTSLYPNGLCVETGWPQAVKQTLRLQQCGTTTLRRQIWSFNYASSFFGTTDGTAMNNLCWSVDQADTIGSQIKLNDTSGGLGNGNTPCNTNFPNNIQSWDMAAEVGPGAAGPATGQIVNFKQFGKCMDQAFELWDQKIFPCKQGPDPKVRDWNQIWFLPAAGQSGTISHDRPGMGRFCLQAPPLTSVPPTTNVVECPAVGPVPQNLVWRSRGADTPTYDERYRLEGTGPWAGYCLQPMPEVPAGVQGSRLGIKPCSGDHLQKWNATPPVTVSGLRNLAEL
jgi:hypothetical protein